MVIYKVNPIASLLTGVFLILILILISRTLGRLQLKREARFDAPWLVSPTAPQAPQDRACLALLRDTSSAGFKKRAKARKQAVEAFLGACEAAAEDPGGSAAELEALLAAGPLNDFGLYDCEGELLGRGMYPAAAMANHSCVPNVALVQEGRDMCMYALDDIGPEDEVTHCYVSLDEEDLKDRISSTWGFKCQCDRCRGADLSEFDSRHRCECGAVVVRIDPAGCVCNQRVLNSE